MNNSAAKVGDIFREAGTAFTKLSEMTLMLQPTDDAPPGSKLTEEEIEMLRGCVNSFAVELNKISIHIKDRTMRHLRTLLEMDTGTIHATSRSLPRQQQLIAQPIDPEPLYNYEWEEPPQINIPLPQQGNTLETEAQQEISFPKKIKNKNDDLLHFNPGIVPPTLPPNIMQEDTIPEPPSSEFDNTNDQSTNKNCHLLVTELVSGQDNSHCSTFDDSSESTRSIGTLYAVLPDDQEPIGFDTNNRSIVTKKGHFTWNQATKTWQCATNSMNIDSESQIIHTTPDNKIQNFSDNDFIGSAQAPAETACNMFPAVNENKLLDFNINQYKPLPNTDPVPGAFTSFFSHIKAPSRSGQSQTKNSQTFSPLISKNYQNDDPFKFVKFQTGNIYSFEKNEPDVESIDQPFKSALECVQAPHETTRYFSSIRAENKEQTTPSSANFTRGTGSKSLTLRPRSTSEMTRPSGRGSFRPNVRESSRPNVRESSRPSGRGSSRPSGRGSSRPSGRGSSRPSGRGSSRPSGRGSSKPSGHGSSRPSSRGSSILSGRESSKPTGRGNSRPSIRGSSKPSGRGSSRPSSRGSSQAGDRGSSKPSGRGSSRPSSRGSTRPGARGSSPTSGRRSSGPSSRGSSRPSRRGCTRPGARGSSPTSGRGRSRPTGRGSYASQASASHSPEPNPGQVKTRSRHKQVCICHKMEHVSQKRKIATLEDV